MAAALAAAMVAVLFQLAHDGFRVDALTTVVVGQSGFDGLLSENRAVDLDGRQTFQSLDNGLVGSKRHESEIRIRYSSNPKVPMDCMLFTILLSLRLNESTAKAKMMELAKKNEPVVRKEIAKADALAEFKAEEQSSSCRLQPLWQF